MIFGHVLIGLALAFLLAVLVRRRLLQIDLSFPWFLAIALLALVSTVPDFVDFAGRLLGILYPPIAVVFLVIFLVLGIAVTLSVAMTRLRERQLLLVRHLAARELAQQERGPAGRPPG